MTLPGAAIVSAAREAAIPAGNRPGEYGDLLDRAARASEALEGFKRSHVNGQFDALIHIDQTKALEPLERSAPWVSTEPPEAYPSAL